MKTIPLIKTDLKGFMRDWKSVALLLGVPLLIIGLVFTSFSTGGKKLPVGAVDETSSFEFNKFRESADRFAEIVKYQTLDSCMAKLREYRVYACIVVNEQSGESKQYRMTVHYENTKEIVGERITSQIKGVANAMDIEYSKKKASRVITEVTRLTNDIESLQSQIRTTDKDLEKKIQDIDRKIVDLKETRSQMMQDRSETTREINEADRNLEQLEQARQEYYTTTKTRINTVQTTLNSLDNLSDNNLEKVNEAQLTLSRTESELETMNGRLKSEIDDMNKLIESYRQFNRNSKEYVAQINQTIKDMKDTKRDLQEYRKSLSSLYAQLETMRQSYSKIANMEPGQVANSMSVINSPSYRYSDENIPAGVASAGNMVMLQTIYSTLLLLVSLFVSLLVSKFITLNQVNSEARPRLGLIRKVSFAEYMASYISSMIIIAGPVACVLLFGKYFFMLPIFENIGQVALIMFLLCSSMVNIGMATAYLVKKKSITLLIGSFMLVFFIFFSGFVLPIEMMREIPATFASVLPGSVALKLFDLTVLYNQPLTDLSTDIALLGGWTVFFGIVAFQVKRLRSS